MIWWGIVTCKWKWIKWILYLRKSEYYTAIRTGVWFVGAKYLQEFPPFVCGKAGEGSRFPCCTFNSYLLVANICTCGWLLKLEMITKCSACCKLPPRPIVVRLPRPTAEMVMTRSTVHRELGIRNWEPTNVPHFCAQKQKQGDVLCKYYTGWQLWDVWLPLGWVADSVADPDDYKLYEWLFPWFCGIVQ